MNSNWPLLTESYCYGLLFSESNNVDHLLTISSM